MNNSKLVILTMLSVLVLAVFAAGGRYYYLSAKDQSCQIQKIEFSKQVCSQDGQLNDWKQIEGLVQVRIPAANTNGEAYLVKKELSNVEWVEHPGWFGFKYNCIFDHVVVVQNNQCRFL